MGGVSVRASGDSPPPRPCRTRRRRCLAGRSSATRPLLARARTTGTRPAPSSSSRSESFRWKARPSLLQFLFEAQTDDWARRRGRRPGPCGIAFPNAKRSTAPSRSRSAARTRCGCSRRSCPASHSRPAGDPVRVRHEPRPLLLALGERFPGEQVVEHLVVLADFDRPETRRADAVLLPQTERGRTEPVEQGRQASRQARVGAVLVDHRRTLAPTFLGGPEPLLHSQWPPPTAPGVLNRYRTAARYPASGPSVLLLQWDLAVRTENHADGPTERWTPPTTPKPTTSRDAPPCESDVRHQMRASSNDG